MFSVVNDLVYDGLMINEVPRELARKFAEDFPQLPGSKWIDVVPRESKGHWIPDEGEQVGRILDVLDRLHFDMSQAMVIGPFRDVAGGIKRYARGRRGLVTGTIHTAQGKQADIVILVLGGDPGRPAARRWAADNRNLVNVAVSRARRRLYVIGDWSAWNQGDFGVLARRLLRSPALHAGKSP